MTCCRRAAAEQGAPRPRQAGDGRFLASLLDSKLLLPLPLSVLFVDGLVLTLQLVWMTILTERVRHDHPIDATEHTLSVLVTVCVVYSLARELIQAWAMWRKGLLLDVLLRDGWSWLDWFWTCSLPTAAIAFALADQRIGLVHGLAASALG